MFQLADGTAGAVVSLACDFNNHQYATMYRHSDLMKRSRNIRHYQEQFWTARPSEAMRISPRSMGWLARSLSLWVLGIALLITHPVLHAQQTATDSLLVRIVDEQGNIGSKSAPPALLKRGPYLGVGVGLSLLEPEPRGDTDIEIEDDTDVGAQLTLGLDINRHWSAELHAADLGSVELSDGSSVDYREWGLSALYYFGDNKGRYNRQGWTGFGRAGVGKLSNQSDGQVQVQMKEGEHFILGAGAERSTRSGFAVRLEAILFDRDASYFQLGLLYRLGGVPAWVPGFPGLDARRAAIAEKKVRMSGKVTRVPSPRDADGDGVLQAADKCEDTPPGIAVGDNGCAVFNGVIDGLTFVSGSAQLTDEASVVLDSVASSLQQIPEARARVTAHTDNLGSADANMQLSRQRALAVAKYLVDKGIRKARLEARAFGEIRPIDTNSIESGRRNNRRVEIDLIAE